MHDFCLTLPYGVIILVGGISGYFASGSTMSLIAGGGCGTVLTFLGYCSYTEYCQSPKVSKTWAAASLAISTVLTGVMGKRYHTTQVMMPAGIIAGLSAGMSLFYISKLLSKNKGKTN